jgi:hypothetical protein
MARFDIGFEAAGAAQPGVDIRHGLIQIGDFRERFEVSVEYWAESDYRAHWRRSVRRVADGAERSCLITSMTDPRTANFLVWWPIYVTGDAVRFQNQLLFLDATGGRFDPQDPYGFVPDRRASAEDGSPISEWTLPVSCLVEFLDRAGTCKMGRESFWQDERG